MATGSALSSLSEPAQNFAVQTENEGVLDFHFALEEAAHDAGLTRTVHGLTETGETFGLGKIGEDNLITDAAQAPGDVVDGATPQGVASNIIHDAGEVVSGGGEIVQGLGEDAANPDLVDDAVDAVTDGRVVDAMTEGAGNVVNGAADNLLDGVSGGLGDLPGGGTGSGAGDSLVAVGAGESGGTPILDTGVLNAAPGDSPIGVAAGSGDNLADIDALDGSSGRLVSADGGAPGNAVLDAGVLTTPDSQTPLNADIGNGTNIANASLLGNSDALQFADLGGTGTDALNGALPNVLGNGIALPGTDPAPATGDDSLIELATDGSDLITTHDDTSSLLGLNNQAIV
jgi:hypothetical protein